MRPIYRNFDIEDSIVRHKSTEVISSLILHIIFSTDNMYLIYNSNLSRCDMSIMQLSVTCKTATHVSR